MLNTETFKFLADIAKHNDREWFAANKDKYETAKADTLVFVEEVIKALAKIDPLISPETPAKKSLMRIYRDVRFSKNKDPYKQNFGIWISAFGKEGSGPGYYLHLQPGKSFFGAGYWMPDTNHLKLIRQEIDYNEQEFREIIDEKAFKKTMTFSTTEILKNAPKGYDPEHEAIQYLKLKSFEVTQFIKDEEFFSPAIVDKLINSFKIVYPFIAFLRNAIAS